MLTDAKGRRVLIVDDDKDNIDVLSGYLNQTGHIVTHASEAEGALHRIRAWKPHIVLLDVNLGGSSGLDLIPKIRSLTQDDYAAVILISANMGIDDVSKGLEAGADDYLTKPFRSQELESRVRVMVRMKELHDNLRRANHRIEELNGTDDLTGLLNVRAIFRRGEEEIQRSRRFRKPVSALMVNLDGFRVVNETADFPFGSHVLRETGARIKKCVRTLDLVARVGADEYFVLLLETDLAGAEFVAERIRDSLGSTDYKDDRHQAKLAASIGVSGFGFDRVEGGMADMVRNAGEALRSAKANGGNRIEIYAFA